MVHSRALPPRLQNTHAPPPAPRATMYTTSSSSSSSTTTLTLTSAPSSSSVSTLLLPNQPWPTSTNNTGSDLFGTMSVVASDPWAVAPTPPSTTTTTDGPRTRKRSNTTAGLMRLNNEGGMPAVPVLPPRMRAVKAPRHQTIPPVSSLLSLTPPPGLPVPPHLAAARPRISSQLNNMTNYANATPTLHSSSTSSPSSLNPESPAFQPRSLLHSANNSTTTNNKPSPPPPPAYLVEFMANKGASAQSKAVASALNDVTNAALPTITPPQLVSLPTSTDVQQPTTTTDSAPTPAPTLPTSTAFLASLPYRSHRAPPPPCRIVADMLLNRVRVGGGYRPRRRHFPLSEHHRYVRSGLSREYRFDSRDSSPRGSPLSSPRIRAVELVELPTSAVMA